MVLNHKDRETPQQDNFSGYTRVTTILSAHTGLDKVDPLIVQHAADRGSKVHQICEAIVRGIAPMGITPEVKGYIRSFEKWWGDGYPIVEVEKRFFCDKLKITGQVDMLIDHPEHGLTIIDLKTSSKPSKTWPLQGSAYAYMARNGGYDIKSIQFIHLSKNGIKPHIYNYQDHFDMFMYCYYAYQYFNDKKKK